MTRVCCTGHRHTDMAVYMIDTRQDRQTDRCDVYTNNTIHTYTKHGKLGITDKHTNMRHDRQQTTAQTRTNQTGTDRHTYNMYVFAHLEELEKGHGWSTLLVSRIQTTNDRVYLCLCCVCT